MIRGGAIFGKVRGHGVKKIWLISQFPAKHTGVANGAKIVFARPGLARLLGYGYGVINNEFIIYIACSPQSDCISFSETHQLLFDPLESEFMSVMSFQISLCDCSKIIVNQTK